MINTILLDMDGVVADFNLQMALTLCPHLSWEEQVAKARICDVHAPGHDWLTVYSKTDAQAWQAVDDADPLVFWSNLHPTSHRFPGTPTPAMLFQWALKHAPSVFFLTAFPRSSTGEVCAGKLEWLRTHIDPDFMNVMLCPRRGKKLLAADDALLIDDNLENCQEFVTGGGKVIHYHPHRLDELDDAIQQSKSGVAWVSLL